jgi:hypothetical protein
VCEYWISSLPDLRVIVSQAIRFRRPFELIIRLADDIFPGEFTDRSISLKVSTLLVLGPKQEGHPVEKFEMALFHELPLGNYRPPLGTIPMLLELFRR